MRQEERAELKAANHRLMKEKALLQDQKTSSDEREDNTHSQVTMRLPAFATDYFH